MTFTFLVTGGNTAVTSILRLDGQIQRAAVTSVRRTTQGGASLVRGRASGAPGPRVITGDYRRSISGDVIQESGPSVIGQIGTSARQARRLEFGFFGTDALGRVYAQQPRPHFQPAIGEIAQLFIRESTDNLTRGLQAA